MLINPQDSGSDLQAYTTALGQIAAMKKAPKQAPGGIGMATPAPMKIRSDNGVTDSDFIRQIIAAAQAGTPNPVESMSMGNNTQMPQDMSTGVNPAEQAAPQQAAPPQGMDALASLFQSMGGGAKK